MGIEIIYPCVYQPRRAAKRVHGAGLPRNHYAERGLIRLRKYKVEIVEKISMTLEVDAPSAEEAILQVIEKYRVEQIVVESNEGTKVDFFVSKVEV